MIARGGLTEEQVLLKWPGTKMKFSTECEHVLTIANGDYQLSVITEQDNARREAKMRDRFSFEATAFLYVPVHDDKRDDFNALSLIHAHAWLDLPLSEQIKAGPFQSTGAQVCTRARKLGAGPDLFDGIAALHAATSKEKFRTILEFKTRFEATK